MCNPALLLLMAVTVCQTISAIPRDDLPSVNKYTIRYVTTLSKSKPTLLHADHILKITPRDQDDIVRALREDTGHDAEVHTGLQYQSVSGPYRPYKFTTEHRFLAHRDKSHPGKRTINLMSKRRLSINHGLQVLSNILGNVRKPSQNVRPPTHRYTMLQNIQHNLVNLYQSRQNGRGHEYKAHIKQKYSSYNRSTIAQMLQQLGK